MDFWTPGPAHSRDKSIFLSLDTNKIGVKYEGRDSRVEPGRNARHEEDQIRRVFERTRPFSGNKSVNRVNKNESRVRVLIYSIYRLVC